MVVLLVVRCRRTTIANPTPSRRRRAGLTCAYHDRGTPGGVPAVTWSEPIRLFQTECIRPGPFHTGPLKSLGDVEFATMAWVDWFNHRRLHSTLAMLTPAETEAAHYAATTALHPEPQPA